MDRLECAVIRASAERMEHPDKRDQEENTAGRKETRVRRESVAWLVRKVIQVTRVSVAWPVRKASPESMDKTGQLAHVVTPVIVG